VLFAVNACVDGKWISILLGYMDLFALGLAGDNVGEKRHDFG
jgi:hypothetical protein